MVRTTALVLRLGVIASAVAMLLVCVHGAHAQDDRYGFVKAVSEAAPAPKPFAAPPSYAGPETQPAYIAPPQQTAYADPQPGGTYAYYSAAPAADIAASYTLGTGDKVKITVYGEEDLSGEYTVDSGGVVRLPLVGEVRATGLTATMLENAVGSKLANGFLRSPRVAVEITTYRPFYVVGDVNRPGEYPYGINMTALKAVALAGGFGDHAVESTLYVRHQDQSEEHEMPTDRLSQILPGDTVRVKKSVFWDVMDVFGPISGTAAIAAAAVH